MKLIGSLTSPYVRKVRIVLHEKKIDHEFVIDLPWEADTHVPECNPLGKVPVLITDDGMILFDSAVIVDFLECATPNNRLLPQPSRSRALVKCIEALAGGICDAGATIFVEKSMHPTDCVSDGVVTHNLLKIQRALDKIAKDLGETTYLFEGTYGLADIAIGCALNFVDALNTRQLIDYDWQSEYPTLAAYLNHLNTKPAFVETTPPPTK